MTERDFTHASFCEYLAEQRLMGSKCRTCGQLHMPPRPICANCFSNSMEWIELSGRGTLAAYTVIHVAPTSMIAAGYGRDRPYCSGVVVLDEGPGVGAQILGIDPTDPSGIRIGAPVQFEPVDIGAVACRPPHVGFRLEHEDA